MASIVTESTGRRRVFFEHAGKRKSVSLGDWNMTTAAKNGRFISDDEMQRVFAACLDLRYKVLFALARYAGLRVPSELPRAIPLNSSP